MRRAWGLALLLGLSCSTARAPLVGEAGPVLEDASAESAWQQTLERYTDKKAIYDGLDTRLFVAATWQSPPFVEARVQRDCIFRGLDDSQSRLRVQAEKDRLASMTEFQFGVYASDSKLDDFDRPNSMWTMTLRRGDQVVQATSIKRIGKARLAMRAFYPYLDEFWVSYVVQFPKVTVAPGESLQLKLASAVGHAELDFKAE